MIRKAFMMQVHPDEHDEYVRRHNPIWPELESTLLAHGVHSYTIFLHPLKSELFAYVEFEDESQWDRVAETEICQKWWAHMKEVMPTNPDNSPLSEPLTEVFHLESSRDG